MVASVCCTAVTGGLPSARSAGGAISGSAARSTFPLLVSGIRSITASCAGMRYGGSRSTRWARSSAGSGAAPEATT